MTKSTVASAGLKELLSFEMQTGIENSSLITESGLNSNRRLWIKRSDEWKSSFSRENSFSHLKHKRRIPNTMTSFCLRSSAPERKWFHASRAHQPPLPSSYRLLSSSTMCETGGRRERQKTSSCWLTVTGTWCMHKRKRLCTRNAHA